MALGECLLVLRHLGVGEGAAGGEERVEAERDVLVAGKGHSCGITIALTASSSPARMAASSHAPTHT